MDGTLADLIFVPEWGWVGSWLNIYVRHNNAIFVPEWGWVGSSLEKEYKGGFSESSSPSGDGLVQRINVRQKGLLKYFRPRLGMGWFM